MRRDELETLRIQLPVLPTIALGALPGDPVWAPHLASIGLDVLASGAARDTALTWAEARRDHPRRAVKAMAADTGDVAVLVAEGARIIETSAPVPGVAYRLGDDEAAVVVVDGADPEVEDPNVVARAVVDAVTDTPPARLWVASSAGLHVHSAEVARAKLRALCEAAYLARLAIAKVQFDLD